MSELDQQVAQMVLSARLLERALHDTGARWEMRWRGHVAPAERAVTENGITFYASFPTLDDDGDANIWLLCNGEEVRSRPLDLAGRHALDFDWALEFEGRESIPTS